MFQQLKGIGILAVVGFLAHTFLFSASAGQTADLGQVLDRTEFALDSYQGHLGENGITEVSDESMAEFTTFYTEVLNTEPRFYEKTLGVEIMEDATFLGFADGNANGIQDEGEDKVFTVEIDETNSRLIATDGAGSSSDLRFSGTGFLAGILIGNMINRQRGAGIAANSFNSRTTTPRSSYRAPTSAARSGGLRAGK